MYVTIASKNECIQKMSIRPPHYFVTYVYTSMCPLTYVYLTVNIKIKIIITRYFFSNSNEKRTSKTYNNYCLCFFKPKKLIKFIFFHSFICYI